MDVSIDGESTLIIHLSEETVLKPQGSQNRAHSSQNKLPLGKSKKSRKQDNPQCNFRSDDFELTITNEGEGTLSLRRVPSSTSNNGSADISDSSQSQGNINELSSNTDQTLELIETEFSLSSNIQMIEISGILTSGKDNICQEIEESVQLLEKHNKDSCSDGSSRDFSSTVLPVNVIDSSRHLNCILQTLNESLDKSQSLRKIENTSRSVLNSSLRVGKWTKSNEDKGNIVLQHVTSSSATISFQDDYLTSEYFPMYENSLKAEKKELDFKTLESMEVNIISKEHDTSIPNTSINNILEIGSLYKSLQSPHTTDCTFNKSVKHSSFSLSNSFISTLENTEKNAHASDKLCNSSTLDSTLAISSLFDKYNFGLIEKNNSKPEIYSKGSFCDSTHDKKLMHDKGNVFSAEDENEILVQGQDANVEDKSLGRPGERNAANFTCNMTEESKDMDKTTYVTCVADSTETNSECGVKRHQNEEEEQSPLVSNRTISKQDSSNPNKISEKTTATCHGISLDQNAVKFCHPPLDSESSMEITHKSLFSTEFKDKSFTKPLAPGKESMSQSLSDISALTEVTSTSSEKTVKTCETGLLNTVNPLYGPGTISDAIEINPSGNASLSKNNFSILSEENSFTKEKNPVIKDSATRLAEPSLCTLDDSLTVSDCDYARTKAPVSFENELRTESSVSLCTSQKSYPPTLTDDSFQKPSCPKPSNPQVALSLPPNASDSEGKWDSFMPENVKSCDFRERSIHLAKMTFKIKNLLAESFNKSTIEKEEMKPLKENLFVIMDLFEKENVEFEAYRKNSEKEKQQLLAKISLLEDKVSVINQTVATPISKQETEENVKKQNAELSYLLNRCHASEERLKQSQKDTEFLKAFCSLRDDEVPQLEQLVSDVKESGFQTEGIFIGGIKNIIHIRTVLNILSLLLKKYNTFVANHNEINKHYEEEKLKLNSLPESNSNYHKKPHDLHAALELNKTLAAGLQEKYENTLLEVNSLCDEVRQLKENLCQSKHKFEQLNPQHENKNSKIICTQDVMSELLKKYEESTSVIKKLVQESSEKHEMYRKLEVELSSSTIEANEIKESYMKLRTVYKKCLLKSERQQLKFNALQKSYDDLNLKYNELSSDKEKLEFDYHVTLKGSEINALKIENLNSETSQLKGSLSELQNDYETESSKLHSLQNLFSNLEKKCQELFSEKENLGKKYLEKEALIGKLIEDGKRLSEELADVKCCLEAKLSEYSELKMKYEIQSSELKSLLKEKNELESNYQDRQEAVATLQKDSSSNSENKDKLSQELKTLKEELTYTRNCLASAKSEYDSLVLTYTEEQRKFFSLKQDHGDLTNKFQEALFKINELESECFSKTHSNELFTREFSEMKLEIEELNNKFSSFRKEYDVLFSKYNEECTKHLTLQTFCEVLRRSYQESLSWVTELGKNTAEIADFNRELREHVRIPENHCEVSIAPDEIVMKHDEFKKTYNCVLSNIDILKSAYLAIMERCEKSEASLREELSSSQQKLIDLQRKYEDKNSKFKLALAQLIDIETRNTEINTTLQKIRKEFADKDAGIKPLQGI